MKRGPFDDYYKHILSDAAKAGNLKFIQNQLTVSRNNFLTIHIQYALLSAAKYGHLEIVQYFIVNEREIISALAKNSALIAAAREGHSAIVEYLLNSGGAISVNCKDQLQAIAFDKRFKLLIDCPALKSMIITEGSHEKKQSMALIEGIQFAKTLSDYQHREHVIPRELVQRILSFTPAFEALTPNESQLNQNIIGRVYSNYQSC